MGDMNAKAEDVRQGNSPDPVANMINNFIVEEGFEQLIMRRPRSRIVNQEEQESISDHLYTNTPERAMMIKIHKTSSSDHAMITFRRARRPRNDYKASFMKELGNVDWEKRFKVNSMERCTKHFTEYFAQALDKQAPLVTFIPSKEFIPEVSGSTRMVMKEIDFGHKTAKFTNTVEDILHHPAIKVDTADKEGTSVEEFSR